MSVDDHVATRLSRQEERCRDVDNGHFRTFTRRGVFSKVLDAPITRIISLDNSARHLDFNPEQGVSTERGVRAASSQMSLAPLR